MFMPTYPPPASKHYQSTVDALPSLEGRTIAITGCTSGTGQVMARTCGARGARILMLNRPSKRADEALSGLADAGIAAVQIPCDLQSFDSVREAAESLAQHCPEGLDLLCNNAGVMGLPDRATADGCDVQMQTNHLSHFLLTSLLWPLLEAAAAARGEARVVNQSSGARRGPALQAEFLQAKGGSLGGDSFPGFGKWRRYQQSKLANLLFTYALHDRIAAERPGCGVKSLCAHPGPTNSGLQAKTSNAGGTRVLDQLILWRTLRVAHSVEDGALGIVRAACDPGAQSGEFYGPAGRGQPGPAERLPAERDPAAEQLLWDQSLATTGVSEFFARPAARRKSA
ncbi:SDR family NAD(P)-dependent oxidoreductase [Haliangium ochraceum]|uniref:Short-chain dehydrogenase/reductase SDR n=1 Tax=Haliangium ochraceum (strain DSM 14365 / JCM 11303 / SMP-2) TaxID=502025 RepID=D0LLB7_HALO1|nr:SDR family NAD(P)-dependent oxidoreductase [Haliangium ochraceum]ACY18613.1 short-chain dehydrogenase/reductase SDR [Haliangium ochraceum DSM 14365]